jgi:hypothetical protein
MHILKQLCIKSNIKSGCKAQTSTLSDRRLIAPSSFFICAFKRGKLNQRVGAGHAQWLKVLKVAGQQQQTRVLSQCGLIATRPYRLGICAALKAWR